MATHTTQNPLWRTIKSLASLRLTVVLFALAMILVLAGTLAQVREGVWTVVDHYFRSLYVAIPFQLFIPEKILRLPGVLPFPGGLTLGVLIFINLLAAHIARFQLSWKRAGIIIAHAGVLLLLVGEFVTGAFAKEGVMQIREGETANYIEDIRTSELAISEAGTDGSGAGGMVVAFPQSVVAHAGMPGAAPLAHPLLPLTVRVDEWMANSQLLGPMQASPQQRAKANAGLGTQVAATPIARASGVDGNDTDTPSAYVTILANGQEAGKFLVSLGFAQTQTFDVGGKQYLLELRNQRTYTPYSVSLIDFRFDKFVGTRTAKNFSSQVRLVDPSRSVDREVLISMNKPMRHAGETFYQQSFMQDERGTVLQVVRNPGWLIPYASCIIVTLGLLLHFGVRLSASIRRRVA